MQSIHSVVEQLSLSIRIAQVTSPASGPSITISRHSFNKLRPVPTPSYEALDYSPDHADRTALNQPFA